MRCNKWAFTILFATGAFFVNTTASAGGTALTLTPSSSSTSPQEIAITWTGISPGYTNGSTITIQSDTAFMEIDECGTPTTDLDNNLTPDGGVTQGSTTTGALLVYALTEHTTSTAYSLCVKATFPPTAINYGLSLTVATSSGELVDYGAALFYANGGNQVTVTADVTASLSFSITDAADSGALVNTCSIGTVTTVATSTCNYRLRIATNSSSGFQAQVAANQDFGTGNATMTNVTNDGTLPVAGTELYGFGLILGATEGGRNTSTLAFTEPIDENSTAGFTFETDPSAVPTSTVNFISYNAQFQTGAAPSTTTTTMVEHAMSVSAGTAAGNYSQILTYTVTGSF